GAEPWHLPDTGHPWFHAELMRSQITWGVAEDFVADDWVNLKRQGFSDADIASWCDTTEQDVRAKRRACGVRPAYRRVDSCAGEVEAASTYYYSTWGEADEAAAKRPVRDSGPVEGAWGNREVPPARTVVILGSGPNRIGQGIEFDYCCVHAAQSFRALG